MTAISTLQKRFIAQQKLIGTEFRPLQDLFNKDPKKYMAQWKKYLKHTEQSVDEFKVWLDYHPSVAEGESNTARSRDRKLRTASVDLARTASKIDDEIGGEFYAHFDKEMKRLKSRHKDYSNFLNSLETDSPDTFSQSFKNIAKDLPRNIKEELKALPYKHPATLYLKLTPEQYNDLNRAADRKKLEKHENISSVSLKKVMAYVGKVYRERHDTDYSHICIALQLATGRRRAELGLLSKITPSENFKGHITIDRFAKSNNAGKIHDLPVVFLTVPQVIELHSILRDLLDTVVFADKKAIWQEIKRKGDTDRFDDYTKRVRITFLNEFKIRGFDIPESDTETLTVHNACRSIYAQFAHKTRHARYRKMSLLAFANRFLGHARGDYKTTENYLYVELIDDRFDSPAAEEAITVSSESPTPSSSHEAPQHATLETESAPSSTLDTNTGEMGGPTEETPPDRATEPFKPKRTRKLRKPITAPSKEIEKDLEPATKSTTLEDTATRPLEAAAAAEMDGPTGEASPDTKTGPLKPKGPVRQMPPPSAETQRTRSNPKDMEPPIKSTLTAAPWKGETPDKGKKRSPPRFKSVAKAPAATRQFFEAVRSQGFVTELIRYSLKTKEPGLLDIQRAMNVKLDRMPVLEDLRAIASEAAVDLYLKFLKKHRIEHAIQTAST